MGEKAVGTIASLAAGGAFVVSLLLAYSLAVHPETVIVPFAEWIHIGTLQLDWTFRVDTLSVTMMLVVSGVGTLIHIYAIGYMHEDVRFKGDVSRYRRFFVFLNLFIAMMMILVSGDSYMMLFVGWEGVGLCSFLLIGFWYDMDTLGRPSFANCQCRQEGFHRQPGGRLWLYPRRLHHVLGVRQLPVRRRSLPKCPRSPRLRRGSSWR